MTRQEVITSFPQEGNDMTTWLICAAICALVFYFSLNLLSERTFNLPLVGYISVALVAFLTAAFVLVVFYFTAQKFFNDMDLPEQRATWVKETFTPYLDSLEKIRVPIFQKRWNEQGEIDILLDTNEHKKNFNGITDFQYYESTNPNDLGYVYIKDIGNLDDFPEQANISLYYDRYLLDSVFLPKRPLDSIKEK